jgi:hypothetical protein
VDIDCSFVKARYLGEEKFQQPTKITKKKNGTVKIQLIDGTEHICYYNVNEEELLECEAIEARITNMEFHKVMKCKSYC